MGELLAEVDEVAEGRCRMNILLVGEEFICPLCGLVLHSLTAFHQHVAQAHEAQKKSPSQSQGLKECQ